MNYNSTSLFDTNSTQIRNIPGDLVKTISAGDLVPWIARTSAAMVYFYHMCHLRIIENANVSLRFGNNIQTRDASLPQLFTLTEKMIYPNFSE